MPKHNRILCPVDLSENSSSAIALATMIAQKRDATLIFCYVAAAWIDVVERKNESYVNRIHEEDKTLLYKIRPTDPSVRFEHLYLNGNAGPELVKAAKKADVVVMSTHGRSGLVRLIMGSVTSYVLRNTRCEVVLVKATKIEKTEDVTDPASQSAASQVYVTEVMHPVPPVHAYETMESVLASLTKARETAVAVISGAGKCVGVLTSTDIEKFQTLQEQIEAKDESAVEEVNETDKSGQRRTSNYNFDQVERHMTKEVISLHDTDSVQRAIDLFEANLGIHHLVVLDEDNRVVGIVDAVNVAIAQPPKKEEAAH